MSLLWLPKNPTLLPNLTNLTMKNRTTTTDAVYFFSPQNLAEGNDIFESFSSENFSTQSSPLGTQTS